MSERNQIFQFDTLNLPSMPQPQPVKPVPAAKAKAKKQKPEPVKPSPPREAKGRWRSGPNSGLPEAVLAMPLSMRAGEVAAELGCGKSTVNHIRSQAGVTCTALPHRHGGRPSFRDAILAMPAEIRADDVAKKLGCGYSTVNEVRREAGIICNAPRPNRSRKTTSTIPHDSVNSKHTLAPLAPGCPSTPAESSLVADDRRDEQSPAPVASAIDAAGDEGDETGDDDADDDEPRSPLRSGRLAREEWISDPRNIELVRTLNDVGTHILARQLGVLPDWVLSVRKKIGEPYARMHGPREYKPIDDPRLEMSAEYIDEHEPEWGESMRQKIYLRAAAIRDTWTDKQRHKATNYKVPGIVLTPVQGMSVDLSEGFD